MMKIKIILPVLFLLGGATYGQENLKKYLVMAAENNPGLKAEFNQYLAAIEQIPQARALPDPALTFSLFAQPVETRTGPQRASIAVSQAFPWFGTLKARGEVATRLAEARLKSFEDRKLALFKEVKITYSDLYFVHKSILLTEENLSLLDSFKELARVNFESGKTGFVDVLRVEMDYEELQNSLALLKDSKQALLVQFENLLNHAPDQPLAFPETLWEETLKETKKTLYDSIVSRNLQLRQLQSQLAAQDKKMAVADLASKPSFTLGMSYINIGERPEAGIPGNGQDAFLFPQAGLNIPLYRKKYEALKNQEALQKESLQYRIEEKSDMLITKLEALIRDHLDAARRRSLYQKLYELAEQSLSLLQTAFVTGKTDFAEVLRMERRLLSYQLELEKARVDANNAVYEVDYLMGRGYDNGKWIIDNW